MTEALPGGLHIGPPPRQKIVHFGSKWSQHGDVSALCFAKPRPIQLAVSTWTICPQFVTCPKCKTLLEKAP